jgi:hypothetical protein
MMATEKLYELFEWVVVKSQNKYDLLDIKIDNSNKLKETYNFLERAISATT